MLKFLKKLPHPTEKISGVKAWYLYSVILVWTLLPISYMIMGEFGKAANLAMWGLIGSLLGKGAWEFNMWLKRRRAKSFIHGWYVGKSTHSDGGVLYTRIPIVMPERAFDFRVECSRGPDDIAQLLIENLQEMYRLEPHLILFLKTWVDDGRNYPPWAGKWEIEAIDKERRAVSRAQRIIENVKNETDNSSMEDETINE